MWRRTERTATRLASIASWEISILFGEEATQIYRNCHHWGSHVTRRRYKEIVDHDHVMKQTLNEVALQTTRKLHSAFIFTAYISQEARIFATVENFSELCMFRDSFSSFSFVDKVVDYINFHSVCHFAWLFILGNDRFCNSSSFDGSNTHIQYT